MAWLQLDHEPPLQKSECCPKPLYLDLIEILYHEFIIGLGEPSDRVLDTLLHKTESYSFNKLAMQFFVPYELSCVKIRIGSRWSALRQAGSRSWLDFSCDERF